MEKVPSAPKALKDLLREFLGHLGGVANGDDEPAFREPRLSSRGGIVMDLVEKTMKWDITVTDVLSREGYSVQLWEDRNNMSNKLLVVFEDISCESSRPVSFSDLSGFDPSMKRNEVERLLKLEIHAVRETVKCKTT